MISLNLEKGMTLDLKKHDNKLNVLNIGLGWITTFDLDSIAYLVDKNGDIIETVCYQLLEGTGVSLDGDDTVGGGNEDNETLTVNFNKVNPSIEKIIICANIYNASPTKKGFLGKVHKGDTFNDVEGSYIRLYNGETKEELCKYSLKEDGANFNAFHFADLIKQSDGTWTFQAVGEGMNGSISELRKQLNNK